MCLRNLSAHPVHSTFGARTKDRDGSQKRACQFERQAHFFRCPGTVSARDRYTPSAVIIMTRGLQQRRNSGGSLAHRPPVLPSPTRLCTANYHSRTTLDSTRSPTPSVRDANESRSSPLNRSAHISRVPKRSAAIIGIIRRRLIIDGDAGSPTHTGNQENNLPCHRCPISAIASSIERLASVYSNYSNNLDSVSL